MKRIIYALLLLLLVCSGAYSQTRPSILQLKDMPYVDPRTFGFGETNTAAANRAALISALNAGAVLIPPGEYDLDNTTAISVSIDSASIVGLGQVTLNVSTQTQPLFNVSADDVTIKNLTIVGLDIYKGQEYRNIGDRPALIRATGADNLTISECSFTSPSVHSVLFYGVTRSSVSGCNFYSNASYTINDDPVAGDFLGYVSHISLYGAAGCSVSNNSFSKSISGIIGNGNTFVPTDLGDQDGASGNTRKNIVEGNYIYSQKGNCIYFSSENNNNIFRGNVLIADAEPPLQSIGDKATILGNQFLCGGDGPNIRGSSDVVFSSNSIVCTASGAVGLFFLTSTAYSSPLHRINISDNVITYNASGTRGAAAIRLYSFKDKNGPARFEDITIHSNTLSGWGGSNSSGGTYQGIIDIHQAYDETPGELTPRGLSINGNRIKGIYGGGYGVSGVRVRGGFFSANISDNVIDGIGEGEAGAYYGMYLQAVSSSIISNNQIIVSSVAGTTINGITEAPLSAFGAGSIGSVVATSSNNIYSNNNIFGYSGTLLSLADASSRRADPFVLVEEGVINTYTLPAHLHPTSLILDTASNSVITPSADSSAWSTNHLLEIFNTSSTTTVTFSGVTIGANSSALFQQTATGSAANTWTQLR